jgi:hypothetical protein
MPAILVLLARPDFIRICSFLTRFFSFPICSAPRSSLRPPVEAALGALWRYLPPSTGTARTVVSSSPTLGMWARVFSVHFL